MTSNFCLYDFTGHYYNELRSSQKFSLAVDSATALMIQYAAFKGKILRPVAACNPINHQYASESRHILDEVDCPPEKRYHVQSALSIYDQDRAAQEKRPFAKLGDSFRKIMVLHVKMSPRIDEKGYAIAGLVDFLLDPSAILV